MQAGRQAVVDVRRTLRWLEQQATTGWESWGPALARRSGSSPCATSPPLRAGAFLHASTYFGEVVSHGLTTKNVWESLQAGVSREELRHYWSPISPFPYIAKLRSEWRRKILLITGRYDPTFWPEFTDALLEKFRGEKLEFESLSLPCGHYSLGVAPFSYVAGFRFGRFFRRDLAE